MGQVPEIDTSPFGIVGAGRVARHFQRYFTLLGRSVRTWSRHAPIPSPPDALRSSRTVLLLIRDEAIVPFVRMWPGLREKRLVHCSGSLVTPVAEAAHPLMTFGPGLYTLAEYQTIPFVLDEGGTPFTELLPGLANPSYVIPSADRPYYHALCVMAGNFSTMLWLRLFDELQQHFGIPASAAYPYLGRVTANLMADGSQALTGPLSRGDAQAVAANLQALEGDPYQAVYAAFARTYDQRP
ncbi:MAG: DUF2520 domain-containing protein [Spirochaetes bacterium]|nr:DUF2520 domain-containing protein [Spirochaetota bacterium]